MKRFLTPLFVLVAVFVHVGSALGAEGARLAVVPFFIHSKEKSDIEKFLGEFVQKLQESGFEVIESPRTVQRIDRKKVFDSQYLRGAAKDLNADYIVWGSITKIGQNFSVDAWIFDPDSGQAAQGLSSETTVEKGLGVLIPGLIGKIELAAFKKELIAKVEVCGNQRIESEAVKARISAKPGDVLDRGKLREDLKAIYNMGYFRDVKIDAKDSVGGKAITFIVEEKPVVKEIKTEGNTNLDAEKIQEVVSVKTNSILSVKDIRDSVEKIRALYREKGYYETDVAYQLTELANNEAVITFKIKEGEKAHIKEIRFSGNKDFSNKELKGIMESSEKGLFSWFTSSGILNRETLERDLSKITSFYLNHGYIEVKIGEPDVIREGKYFFINIPIEEGCQFGVGKIDISGEFIRPKEQLLELVKLRKEKVFSRDVLRRDVLTLTDLYADEGYAYADINPETRKNETEKTVDITFVIEPGEKVYFDRIEIVGNTKTRDKVIRRELRITEGEQFSAERLRKSQQRLQKLGYFEDVNITPVKGPDENKMDLKIDVKERPTGAFSIGGGYSSVDNFIGMAEISQRNLFGRGQDLTLNAHASSRTTRYNLSFTDPYFLDTNWATGIDLYDWEREYDDYTKDSTGAGLRLGYPLDDNTRLFGGYRYEEAHLNDIRPNASVGIRESADINYNSSVSASLERDTRNSYIDPSAGSINSMSIEYAGVLGGDSAYTKYILKSGWYLPLFWDTTFHTNASLGVVHENNGGKLPVYEKFYLGGINSVRGFKFGDISPIDEATGERIGGEYMALLNLEYIFPVVKKAGLKGVVFFDAGNVYSKDDGFFDTSLRTSVGFGFRWLSPIGPLRIEWGYNLDPMAGEESSNWDFTIGGAF